MARDCVDRRSLSSNMIGKRLMERPVALESW
jgi:hypothetical protein